jgi:S-methylmethionine-dependent homocysteine/selenocysteine methylase
MNHYRSTLPQLESDVFLTDGGLETTLIFHQGIDLPHFASFVLLDDEQGQAALRAYYRTYLDIATQAGRGFVLESATWRANPNWAGKMGIDRGQLVDINRRAIEFIKELRDEYAESGNAVVISGNIGPAADGYVVADKMSTAEAADYHRLQAEVFAETGADMITAMTLTYPEEAIGVVRAGRAAGLPVVVGFTTETDGRLPNGQTLKAAIEQVDGVTDSGPAYYMINCAHTDHFNFVLDADQAWTQRIRSVRANASRLSHAELDECDDLDDGDPREFAQSYRDLQQQFPRLSVFGGCCGTDHRHIAAMAAAIH